jgi:acyl-CoA thioesterase
VGIDAAGVVAALRARDHCSETLGIAVIHAAAGTATVEMTVRRDMCNGHGTCHGGMIFTLADSAMGYASNSHDVNALATGASVEFLQPAHHGESIRAVATERHLGGRTGIYDVAVSRTDGTVVALFRGRTLRVGGSVVPSDERAAAS